MTESWKLTEKQVETLKSLVDDVPVGGARFNCACGFVFASDDEQEVFKERARHWLYDCTHKNGDEFLR